MIATTTYEAVQGDLGRIEERFRESAGTGLDFLGTSSLQSIVTNGKRLRPMLVLLSAKLFPNYHLEKLIPLGVALEMVHLATLIHDDIIDRAVTRRGAPTVNAQWGNDTAILVGDFFFAKTARAISEVENHRVIRELADTISQVCEGALIELRDAHNPNQTIEHYYERTRKKTASLLACCAYTAALVCGATEREAEALRDYGTQLGMAFQIVDDVLDYAGAGPMWGKPTGNDLRSGNVTLPLLYYWGAGNNGNGNGNGKRNGYVNPRREELRRLIAAESPDEEEVDRAVREIAASPHLSACLEIADRYGHGARVALDVFPESEARQTMLTLIDVLLSRQY